MDHGRILVTGAAGMLGSQLLLDAPPGVLAVGTDLREAPEGNPPVGLGGLDLVDVGALDAVLDAGGFGGVIHAAAYTAVDKAEQEPELAHRVNAEAAGVLARACALRNLPLVAVSTDFVFDGSSRTPYAESAAVAPLGVYGRSKRAGEVAALEAWEEGTRIVRTQWLYGPRGEHFPGAILRAGRERGALSVVADQVGSPTSTLELAPALWDVLALAPAGIYHAACEGCASWYEFAREALRLAELTDAVELSPCTTAEYPTAAPRPAYSVLDSSKLAGVRGRPMAGWTEALVTFMGLEQGQVIP
jgi:dTDP-4-dehydrorhamnose reductase